MGTADDFMDADGIKILTFTQASKAAQAKFTEWSRAAVLVAGGEVPHEGPYTVADVWRDYLADARVRGVHGVRIMDQIAQAHILPELGAMDVTALTPRRVQRWHQELAQQPRRRTGRARREGEEVIFQEKPATDDERRARRDTANRILTNLKAALNFAQRHGHGRGVNWSEVKPFRNVSQARVRFLSVEEQQRLVNACPPEFRALVQGALFTGARYGELTKLQVRDFNAQAGTLFIQFGKAKGGGYKPRHVALTEEGQRWFVSHSTGRRGDELMFRRGSVARSGRKEALSGFDGWAAYDEVHAMELACEAGQVDKVTFHELRHTYASGLVNRGVPLAFVAEQLGHSDIRMVQKHYGHLAPSAKAEAIRSLAPVLGIGGLGVVQPLEIAKPVSG
ncbi:tyrosine-type recombinase/integrase [Mesoterricola sediminis]|uniref:tyrosine-type recombinase/integrase n=1 Tax=Mesoterricola sediminis TaxID=2927980 RepID=UPI00292E8A22|nr:tyrosine-type recombinase/integrase [Mesoterricola sediminis]